MRQRGWGKVGPMTGREGENGPGYGLLQEVRAYWDGLRAEGSLPDRASIDPRGLEHALEHVFLVERIAPGLARFRIAGMHLTVLMGMEVRGMPLSSFIAPAAREAFALALVDLFERPARVEIDLYAKAGLGRPEMTGRLMLWPLRSDLGDVSRALGCLVTQGEIGRASRRFEMRAVRVLPLDAETKGRRSLDLLPGGLRNEWRERGAPRGRAHLRVVR